jgi:hypothetical protein
MSSIDGDYQRFGGKEVKVVKVFVLGGEPGLFCMLCQRSTLITDGRPKELESIPDTVYGPLATSIQALMVGYRARMRKLFCIFLLPMFALQLTIGFWGDTLGDRNSWIMLAAFYVYVSSFMIYFYKIIGDHIRKILDPGVEEILEKHKADLLQYGYTVIYVSNAYCCPSCYLLFSPPSEHALS